MKNMDIDKSSNNDSVLSDKENDKIKSLQFHH